MHPSASHARWLHELRNVVSTASVAASMGRRLVRTDIDTAAELLAETESALRAACELLAVAGEHLRDDVRAADSFGALPAEPRRTAARTVGEEIDRNRERRRIFMRGVADAPTGLSRDAQPILATPERRWRMRG
jgi:hypothetical protein